MEKVELIKAVAEPVVRIKRKVFFSAYIYKKCPVRQADAALRKLFKRNRFRIYHTAVYVEGFPYEWNYGGEGIQEIGVDKCMAGTRFLVQVPCGTIELTNGEIAEIIKRLRRRFRNNNYDLVARNCNVFTDTLLQSQTIAGFHQSVGQSDQKMSRQISFVGGGAGAVKGAKSMHVNPMFLNDSKSKSAENHRATNGPSNLVCVEAKQKELLRLEQRKRELEEERNLRLAQAYKTPPFQASSSLAQQHAQLQSVVTIPSKDQQRDPRLSRGASAPGPRRPSTSAPTSNRIEKGANRGETGGNDRVRQLLAHFRDVDLRSRNNAALLPPKKRELQSPLIESEPESSSAKEKRRRSDVEIKKESPHPFGSSDDQDLRFLYRSPQPITKIKEEIIEDNSVEVISVVQPQQPVAVAFVREKTPPTKSISPVQQIFTSAAVSAPSSSIGGIGAVGSPVRPTISAPVGVGGGVVPKSENPGFDPILANNRIYVDGRPYDVIYIEDVAVIERNGLPHRIYFVGVPRDVVVDGFAHTLAFGESKTISVDGQQHVIRFGASSKELYMGPFPFRGSFGGPPIRVTINGVQHKIQLCGPPPEVKIDPEPAYELLRYVKESHMLRGAPTQSYGGYGSSQQQQTPQTSRRPVLVPSGLISTPTPLMPTLGQFQPQTQSQFPPMGQRSFEQQQQQHQNQRPFLPIQPCQQQAPTDVMGLLSKLVNSGILHQNKPVQQQMQQQQQRSATPPIPSKNRFGDDEVVEKRNSEPDLTDFATGSLKIRYAAVVEALYQQKIQCSTCGMRFPDNDRQKYSKHLDWHFQQSRRDKDRTNIRPWYLAADDWIKYQEVTDENTPKVRSAVFESAQKERQQQQLQQGDDNGRVLVVSTDSVIPATDDDQDCAVCGEKFEQLWDEDDEQWKMRNATRIRGRAYHPLCYQDVRSASVDSEPEAAPSFAPLPEDFMASNSSGEESKP